MRFGTDGVRGRVNTELTVEGALGLGRAIGSVLGPAAPGGRSEAVIGGDTRESTAMLEAAVVAGLGAQGVHTVRLGVAPTPMVAFHAARRDAVGVVISASHNPFHDNGIKVFGPGGLKLGTAVEERIEAAIATPAEPAASPGGERRPVEAEQHYIDHLLEILDGRRLSGARVVIDTANGAASALAREVFGRAGAHVEVMNDEPDGRNINVACGATDPSALGRHVAATGATLGLALDGDADRLIAVDERGAVVDGDRIIALCATDLRARALLRAQTVVVTVMTNLGFHRAMAQAGVSVVQTPVGDRSVLEALDAGGYSLGGEQSGHIIFRDHASTGDGLLTALVLTDLVMRADEPLSVLAGRAMERLPQVLVNVAVSERVAHIAPDLQAQIDRIEDRLDGAGRVLVRPSGTEPLVRVMVEAPSDESARTVADEVSRLVANHLDTSTD